MINGRFHEDDYDGVVLKVPSWFIKLNGLEKDFAAFETALKTANKSMFLPDHVNNLYELENRDVKVEQVKAEEASRKKAQQERNDKQRKIISGEIYELQWTKEHRYLDRDYLQVGEERFDEDDYFTNKCNIKSEFNKKIHSLVNSFETLKEFARWNCHHLSRDMERAREDMIDLNYSIYCTRDATLGISYSHLEIKTDWCVIWDMKADKRISCDDAWIDGKKFKPKIETVWEAAIDFIKWHNKQKV